MIRPLVVTAVVLSATACAGGPGSVGSGSSSSGSGSSSGMSSSSSGSSGPVNCGAICSTDATLTFDEPNTNGRLDGVIIETCLRDQCEQGRLMPPDAGAGYSLQLTPTTDGGAQVESVDGQVTPSPTAGSLRFRIAWRFGFGSPTGVADGDTYSVAARTSPSGPDLFNRTFVATYRDTMVCGSTCKTYRSPAP